MINKNYKTFFIMLFIVILGTLLRLIFIDKPDGLWNDEYVSWSIAVIPFGKRFIEEIASQCHMPFYYLYLKFFIHFFNDSDLMLRLTSVLAGILSIISMYFVGKEYKNEKLGILCASVASLSSFLIYFSQEVRFYEILFLFSSLSLLFTLQLLKKQNIFNLILYIISNFLIIFTHTIGFVFVFFNLIFLSFWLFSNEKHHAGRPLSKLKRNINLKIGLIWLVLLLLSLIIVPLTFNIFAAHSISQWWGHFSLSKIGFLITDYFSPILTNIVNAPDNFFYNFTFKFIVFALVPSFIAIAGIIKALKEKDTKIIGLFYVTLAFLSILVIASLLGRLVFITKYSVEIYPILILIMTFGLLKFGKWLRYFLIFSFCSLNLFYILSMPTSAPKMHRAEGHKIVANLLKNAGLENNDFILLNYYPRNRFERYFNFNKYNVISINKGSFQNYLGVNSKEAFKKIDIKYLDKKLNDNILTKFNKNQKIAVLILNTVSMYSPMQMKILVKNKKEFKKTPFLFLVFSQLKNEEFKYFMKNLQILRIEQKGSWSVVTFKKRD